MSAPTPEVVSVPAVRLADGSIHVGLPENLTRDHGGGVWLLDEGGVGYYGSTNAVRVMAAELVEDAQGERDRAGESMQTEAAVDWLEEATEQAAGLRLLADEIDQWERDRVRPAGLCGCPLCPDSSHGGELGEVE
ncbi:MAG TPA: hypothetical protein VMW08_00555 [Acidimicrobiales bacterium]|nr:hypothetical protein [Acidimicrobiales bacterium]